MEHNEVLKCGIKELVLILILFLRISIGIDTFALILYAMKYSELIKIVRKAGCVPTGAQMGGHPLWINPNTGVVFKMSNHLSQEVATGTCIAVLKAAGVIKKQK